MTDLQTAEIVEPIIPSAVIVSREESPATAVDVTADDTAGAVQALMETLRTKLTPIARAILAAPEQYPNNSVSGGSKEGEITIRVKGSAQYGSGADSAKSLNRVIHLVVNPVLDDNAQVSGHEVTGVGIKSSVGNVPFMHASLTDPNLKSVEIEV